MTMKAKYLSSIVCGLLFPVLAICQNAPSQEDKAVAMITQIYTEVSGENAEQVDWNKIRSFFVEEAVIVLKTSREGNSQFSLEEFIRDFKDFYETPAARQYGFKEEVLRLKAEVHKELAFIAVVYASSFPNSGRPPQKGIDFWLLTLKDHVWKVVAVTNEVILPGEQIPAMFERQ